MSAAAAPIGDQETLDVRGCVNVCVWQLAEWVAEHTCSNRHLGHLADPAANLSCFCLRAMLRNPRRIESKDDFPDGATALHPLKRRVKRAVPVGCQAERRVDGRSGDLTIVNPGLHTVIWRRMRKLAG